MGVVLVVGSSTFAILSGLLCLIYTFGEAGISKPARLVWLAPPRAPAGMVRVGLTQLNEEAVASLPNANIKVSAGGAQLIEEKSQGPVRVFSIKAAKGEINLEAHGPRGESASAKLVSRLPSRHLRITVNPTRPIKGKDEFALLSVSVLHEDGTPDINGPTPIVHANVGVVESLSTIGKGNYTARYILPKERYPEIAIVVAFLPGDFSAAGGAVGVLAIPLSSAVKLPGKTEPYAKVSLDIAGTKYGPTYADEKGNFEMPIVVPAGCNYGISTTTDGLGNSRVERVNLNLPRTDQIACVANYKSLPADGKSHSRFLCTVTNPQGTPISKAEIIAKAKRGKLEGPININKEFYEWNYIAPLSNNLAEDEVFFKYPEGGIESQEIIPIQLTASELSKAVISIEPEPVFAGSSANIWLRTYDLFNNPVSARPNLKARLGELSAFSKIKTGVMKATYSPPSSGWSDIIQGVALPSLGNYPTRIRLTLQNGQILARVEDNIGKPVERVVLDLNGRRDSTNENGIVLFDLPMASGKAINGWEIHGIDNSFLETHFWPLKTAEGIRIFPDDGSIKFLDIKHTVSLAPKTPVDIRVSLEKNDQGINHIRYRITDLQGHKIDRRKVIWSVNQDNGAPAKTGNSREDVDGSTLIPLQESSGSFVISITDVASGVSIVQQAVLH